jgi:hypothetical protein
MMTVYELSSASGATVMFIAVLVLSLGTAMGLYAVLVRYFARRALFHSGPTLPPFMAALLCTALFGLLFKVMHATALQGFYRVELLDSEVRLHSLFPARTVTLPRGELAQLERVSMPLGLGHLRLRTVQGTTYESALTSEGAVHGSWEGLCAYLGCSGSSEHSGNEAEEIAQER